MKLNLSKSNIMKVSGEIYDDNFVKSLFDRMSKTYGITNYISSVGFTERWRKKCVKGINWTDDMKVGYDLMSGMGESWNLILKESNIKIIGLDISSEMNTMARENLTRHKNWQVEILEQNVLNSDIKSESGDFIISTFGLKTFSVDKQKTLAKEMSRILRTGGQISLIEISEPENTLLKIPYMFYLKYIIPTIGRLFMGNSSDYNMLGVYCQNFKNCHQFKSFLEEEGLNVKVTNHFFGCATGIVGYK